MAQKDLEYYCIDLIPLQTEIVSYWYMSDLSYSLLHLSMSRMEVPKTIRIFLNKFRQENHYLLQLMKMSLQFMKINEIEHLHEQEYSRCGLFTI